jgi:hypothetical protein
VTDSIARLSSRHWTAYARSRDDGEVDVALQNAGTSLDALDDEWAYDTVAAAWLDRARERYESVETVSPAEFPDQS